MKKNRNPNPEWDPVFKANYRGKLLSSESWVKLADALLDSAAKLELEVAAIWKSFREWNETKDRKGVKSDEILSIYLMLVAFAVENLLKAQLVRKYYDAFKEEFDSSGKLPALLKSHKLFSLAKKADLSIGLEEEDLLRRLSRAATWSGRYPLPIEFQDLSGGEKFSDGKTWSVSHLGGQDVQRLKKLIAKIRSEFNL